VKKALLYGTILIAVYLGVTYATGAGTDITDATSGAASVITAFQGRTSTGTTAKAA
jgi:hypothetical protein